MGFDQDGGSSVKEMSAGEVLGITYTQIYQMKYNRWILNS